MAAVVDSLGEAVHLLGHSYGALCALEAALLTPYVLSWSSTSRPCPAESSRPGSVMNSMTSSLWSAGRGGGQVLAHGASRDREFAELLRADPSWAVYLAAAHTLGRETRGTQEYRFEPWRFADLRVPTLLLEGELSLPTLKVATAAVHAALPQSRVVVMPGQGHVAQR